MLYELARTGISFFSDEESARRVVRRSGGFERISVYDGEIIEETSALQLVEIYRNNNELFEIVRDISDRGVISSVDITAPSDVVIEIFFLICREHTPLLRSGASFNYIEGLNPVIEDGSYLGGNKTGDGSLSYCFITNYHAAIQFDSQDREPSPVLCLTS